jgi:chromatin remodeling complex protein RSC6
MPAKSKAPKAPKKTKTSKKVKETPAPVVEAPAPVVEAPAPAPVVEAPVVEAPVEPQGPAVSEEFDDLLQELKVLKQSIIDMTSKVAKLQKRVAKESRKGKKPQRNTSGNKNNGFSKPVEITAELCQFLGLEKGTLIARTDVTKGITKYIKEHQLQGEEDKRVINADAALKKLLSGGEKKLSADVPLTYFNLQTYLKRHYPKAVSVSK